MEETASLWGMRFGLNDDLINEIFPYITTDPMFNKGDFLDELLPPLSPPIQHHRYGKGKELKLMDQVLKPSPSTKKACLDFLQELPLPLPPPPPIQHHHIHHGKGKESRLMDQVLKPYPSTKKACLHSLSYGKKLDITKKRLQDDYKQCNKACLDPLSYKKKLEMTKKRLHDDYEQCNKARKTTRLMEYIDLPPIPQHGCGAALRNRNQKKLKRGSKPIIKLCR